MAAAANGGAAGPVVAMRLRYVCPCTAVLELESDNPGELGTMFGELDRFRKMHDGHPAPYPAPKVQQCMAQRQPDGMPCIRPMYHYGLHAADDGGTWSPPF